MNICNECNMNPKTFLSPFVPLLVECNTHDVKPKNSFLMLASLNH